MALEDGQYLHPILNNSFILMLSVFKYPLIQLGPLRHHRSTAECEGGAMGVLDLQAESVVARGSSILPVHIVGGWAKALVA